MIGEKAEIYRMSLGNDLLVALKMKHEGRRLHPPATKLYALAGVLKRNGMFGFFPRL